jgi:hypothetical protein
LKKLKKTNETQWTTNTHQCKINKTLLYCNENNITVLYCTVFVLYNCVLYCSMCTKTSKRHSQPASQPAKQPAGRPKTKPIQKHQAAGRLAGRPAKTQTESGRPAGRGPYTRLAGRLAELNTDWPAGRARNSRTSSPHSLCFSNVFHIFSATLFSEFSQWKLNFTSMIFDKCSFHILSAIFYILSATLLHLYGLYSKCQICYTLRLY